MCSHFNVKAIKSLMIPVAVVTCFAMVGGTQVVSVADTGIAAWPNLIERDGMVLACKSDPTELANGALRDTCKDATRKASSSIFGMRCVRGARHC